MRREDWLWLLIKAAGLWLIVVGIDELAVVGIQVFRPSGLWDTSTNADAVAVLLLFGSGLFLLFVDVSKWLRRMARQDRAARVRESGDAGGGSGVAAGASMVREDWFWVGVKLFGVYFLAEGVRFTLGTLQMIGLAGWDSSAWSSFGAAVAYALFGLWLLRGGHVFRMATKRSPNPPTPAE